MGRNIKEKIGFALWKFSRHFYKTEEYKNNENDLYLGCFKKFSIYHLIKKLMKESNDSQGKEICLVMLS